MFWRVTSNRLTLLLVCLLMFAACVNRGRQSQVQSGGDTDLVSASDSVYVFDLEKSIGSAIPADTFTLNTIVDNVQYIPLETNEKSLFRNFGNHFVATEQSFFVSGGNAYLNILQFDTAGNFIGEIVRNGRGPGELPMIMSWGVNKSLNKLYATLLSMVVSKSLDTGDTYNITLEEAGRSPNMAMLNDSSFVTTKLSLRNEEADLPYLTFFDSNGKVVNSVNYTYRRNVSYETIEGKLTHPYECYWVWANYRGGAIFQDVFNDTLYYINDRSSIVPYTILQRGKFSPRVRDVYDDDLKAKQIYFGGVTETEKYLLIKYGYAKKLYTDIWNKYNQTVVSRIETSNSFSRREIYSARYTLPNGSETILNIVYAEKDKLYCLLEASVACNFMDNVEYDDNPVVMILQLKQ